MTGKERREAGEGRRRGEEGERGRRGQGREMKSAASPLVYYPWAHNGQYWAENSTQVLHISDRNPVT